ncbi:MAG: four helix bundle protein [Verrucomicrobiota bacterium]
MDFVDEVYEVTRSFPTEEIYGLTSQLRRSGVSIPSNVAEGHGRKSTKEFLRHLSIAYGSLIEAETQLIIAGAKVFSLNPQLHHISKKTSEIGKRLNGLSASLKRSLTPDP